MAAKPLVRSTALTFMLLAGFLAASAHAETWTIEHVTLIDGTGRAPKADMTVVVEGDKITAVVPSAAAGASRGKRIDGRGKFLIPGLWDTHIHLRGFGDNILNGAPKIDHAVAEEALASFLYDGVTTVIDAGNAPENILYERARERAGEIQSPRIFASGNMVTYPGSHGDSVAVRIADFEKDKALLDKQLAEQKPDILKLTYDEEGWGARPMITLMPLPLLQQIIQYYNMHGVRTMVHTSNERRTVEAISVGVDVIAHPIIQGPVSDNFVKLMAAKKTPFSTTMTIGENYSRLVEHPEFLDQPDYVATLSKAEITRLKTTVREDFKTRTWTSYLKLMTPICQENIRKVVAGGGVAALGTDQSSGPAVHREMELLIAAGIKPLEVIKIATHNAAVYLGRADTMGSVEPEMLADLVLLNADPLVDIDNTKNIAFVMKGGKIIDESTLPLGGGPQARRFTLR